jgi:hypothetical protein
MPLITLKSQDFDPTGWVFTAEVRHEPFVGELAVSTSTNVAEVETLAASLSKALEFGNFPNC